MKNTTKLYVGTYAKFTEGSIEGAWLTLNDYDTLDDFLEACKELHKDEQEPEFMFQDYDGPPFGLYSECCCSQELFNAAKAMELAEEEGIEPDAMEAFLELYGVDDCDDPEDLIDKFNEYYFGYFDSDWDLGYYCAVDSQGINIPSEIEPYFDFEAYGRACSFDFSKFLGYYFTT